MLTLRLSHSSEIQGIFEFDFQFIQRTGQSTNFFKKRNLGTKCYDQAGLARLTVAKIMKCAKDQSTFCRSHVFMEKFKLAQNKIFTEVASDMWTLRDTAKLLNISYITGTFQVFCLQFKNIFFSNCIQWGKWTQSHEYYALSEAVPVSVLYCHIQVTENTVLTRHSPTSSAYCSTFQSVCDTGTSSSTFDFTATSDYLQKFMWCGRFCHLHR